MRMNFPSAHPLYGHPGAGIATPNLTDADVILALEAQDLWGITHKMTGFNKFGMESQPTIKPGAKVITVSAIELNHKSNYQDFGRYVEADLAITGDPEATLPELIEAVKKLITPDRRRALQERGAKIAAENQARPRRAIANWPPSAGTPAPSPPRASPPRSGRRSRMKTGRWYRTTASSVPGPRACGISASPITTSARKAAPASATRRPPPWARLSPIRNTDA